MIVDKESMNDALDELFEKYNAMKVLMYSFPEEIYTETSWSKRRLRSYSYIERTQLMLPFQEKIAEQTNVWKTEDIKGSKEHLYKDLQPIDLDDVKHMVQFLKNQMKLYLEYLNQNRKGDFIELFLRRFILRRSREKFHHY